MHTPIGAFTRAHNDEIALHKGVEAKSRGAKGRRDIEGGKFSRAVRRGSLALGSTSGQVDEEGMAERSNASSTSSLTLPPMPGTSPDGGASPRRAVSPLLEIRRPHCTLNCEFCNVYLEDIYKHSMCCDCPSRVWRTRLYSGAFRWH